MTLLRSTRSKPVINFLSFTTLLVKHQTSNLNTLPPFHPLRGFWVNKRRMRRPMRDPLHRLPLPTTTRPLLQIHPRRSTVETLDEHRFLWLHVFHVVEFVGRAGRDAKRLPFDGVAVGGGVRRRGRQAFFAAVVVGITVTGIRPLRRLTRCSRLLLWAVRVEQVDRHEVVGRGRPPIYHRQWEIRCRVRDGPPDVDDLVAARQQLFGFRGGQVAAHPRGRGRGRLVDVHLLHGLARRGRVVFPDGVVENHDLLDARELGFQ